MAEPGNSLIGVGLYTLAEAANLTRVPTANIRRWLFGYRYRRGDAILEMPAVWQGQIGQRGDVYGLGFLDLIEVRFVNAFRQHGVSWAVIRAAARRAKELFDSDHPFATQRFRTDGRRIFAELSKKADGERALLDLAGRQFAFHIVVAPSLFDGIEFRGDREAVRWYPASLNRQVVIDPQRAFGRPIVVRGGVPTAIIAKSVSIEKSVERVARWYDISKREVEAAVKFERQRAA